jgi:hypothetical protein
MSLQPETTLRIDNYRFERGDDGSERGFLSLLKGGFRTVTGLIGKRNKANYQVNTPTATIGIRGTEFAVSDGGGAVFVGEGSISVCNTGGCTFVGAGETVFVPDAVSKPQIVLRSVDLPPAPPPPPPAPVITTGDVRSPDGGFEFVPTPPAPDQGPRNLDIPSGSGAISVASLTTSGGRNAGIVGGSLTFAAGGALTTYVDCCGSINYRNGVVADHGSDGIVAWGRWTGGTVDTGGPPLPLQSVHYAGSPFSPTAGALASLSGTMSVIGSSAPTVTSGATVLNVGTPNAVTGTLTLNFSANTVALSLNIPVLATSFDMTGTGVFEKSSPTDARFFVRTGAVTGATCGSACIPDVPFAPFLAGHIHGTDASRASGIYRFQANIGDVTGSVAFRAVSD